jgi:hypothetical protein
MTPRMRHAVRCYVNGDSVTAAAARAGLSRERVSRSIHRPRLARHIARVLHQRAIARARMAEICAGLRDGRLALDLDGWIVPVA